MLNFFLPINLICPFNFRKKISILFLRFLPEFRCSNIFAVTKQTRNQIFWWSIKKIFFLKIFTFVLLGGFLDGFSKFWLFIVKICIFNWYLFSYFRKLYHAHAEHTWKRAYAHWAYEEWIFTHAQPVVKCEQFLHVHPCSAYAERISSHSEHTWNEFHRWLSIHGMYLIAGWAYAEMFKSWISRPNQIRFSKILCYRPLGPFGFCKKSERANFLLNFFRPIRYVTIHTLRQPWSLF